MRRSLSGVRPFETMNTSPRLSGKRGLIVGIANDQSIAWGCARGFRDEGAELAVTYLNEKAEPYVRPLAESLEAAIIRPLDFRIPGALDELYEEIGSTWGHLDFLLHAVAFAPKEDIHGRLVDSSPTGFSTAMEISVHTFCQMLKRAEPLMADGGCGLTLSYFGSERVVPRNNLMGPVKAALESSVRYLAHELGPRRIRVNAFSPGPVRTRAASGLQDFESIVAWAEKQAPLGRVATISEIGRYAAFLVSDDAAAITGETLYIDGGAHQIA